MVQSQDCRQRHAYASCGNVGRRVRGRAAGPERFPVYIPVIGGFQNGQVRFVNRMPAYGRRRPGGRRHRFRPGLAGLAVVAERERQGRLHAELKEINYILENAIIIDDESSTNNLGKHITVIYEDDNTSFDFQLIGTAIESDPLNGKISIESPLGRAVLEANVGSRVLVKPEQGKEFTVVVTHIGKK